MATDALADFLNRDDHVITVNGRKLVKVFYISALDKYSFHVPDNVNYTFSRENILNALSDEGPDGIPFYIFIDTMNMHHIVKLYRIDSNAIMQHIRENF